MCKPVITVFGAMGARGGFLARALPADPGRHFSACAGIREPDGQATRLAANESRIPLARGA